MSATTTVLYANLRHGKSQAASLLLFVLIASMFLSLGLMMMTRFSDTYDQRSEALHAPHLGIAESNLTYDQSHADYVSSYPGVTETETIPTLRFAADLSYGGTTGTWMILLSNAADPPKMNGLALMEGAAPAGDDEAAVPYILKVAGGYEIGDTLALTVVDKTISFKISGFAENLLLGANGYPLQLYVTPRAYADLGDTHPDWAGTMILARMGNPADAEKLYDDYARKYFVDRPGGQGAPGAWLSIASYGSAKLTMTYLATIIAAIVLVFSGLLAVVALLITRFGIKNNIEESMTNTGALKATGYTGGQLLRATLLQFVLIAVAGVVAGIGLSYAVLPAIAGVLELQTGLRVGVAFDPVSSSATAAAILLTITIVTLLSAWRIRQIQPLTALRQGLATHCYKRNYFPLHRSHGPVAWLLAIKAALHSKGQVAMLFIIIAGVGFAAGAGASMYDNLAVHTDAFARLLEGELPDITASAKAPGEVQLGDIETFIAGSPDVRKTYLVGHPTIIYDDRPVSALVTDDFSLLEGSSLYEGRYPKNDNEIAVSSDLGKHIGDAVKVSGAGQAEEYLVVGTLQGMRLTSMTTSAYERLDPAYQPTTVFAYLTDGGNAAGFADSVNNHFGKNAVYCADTNTQLRYLLDQYATIFKAVTFAILAITLLVIMLSIWLLMKTVIQRRRQEFGILKTVGFTTGQIMNQLALYFTPVIAVGLLAGSLAGALAFNPIFVSLTASQGIHTANMPTPYALTLGMCGVLIFLSYLFSMLVAWRTRKISAVSLITE